ncbi:MAG: phosphoribosylformylglycinamidine synthase, partial [Lachnospiraceae bacterium]|nr:phosphoribosylformylglycinamidine synthase [Lachnospiraceae bacterium]
STELTAIDFGEGFYRTPIETSYHSYLDSHHELFKERDDKYICLMDLAQIAMRKLKKDGRLNDMEETDEINACSIVVPVEVTTDEGVINEEWLVMFKNETHNHPTEIEPFGGAATCLGGAIRDPLSGRGYVYQAMRITGAADPTTALGETLRGKLPQKKLVTTSAHGYSSYGNQIGLSTGLVKEIYHPNYVAKRLEMGAVIAAAPRSAVVRKSADPGDIIILLGGRTGRDGCGGATGSSKVHTESSIETCGAEVQKGNAPTERKIVRLFRRSEVSRLIKKCNDFGAGGVSVAIGELAPGLVVDLDRVPKKYAGLDGTELAISESQERMAVVVDPDDVNKFLAYAAEENLEAAVVACVTKEERLVLKWRGKKIVDLSRAFLDTNGAHQEAKVLVKMPDENENPFRKVTLAKVAEDLANNDYQAAWLNTLSDLNVCSQKGLVEMFDSSIGAGNVIMPYGGKYQLTENQTMIGKLPLLNGETDTVTMMSHGFDPYLSDWSPYHGAIFAITESIAKIVASGGDYQKIRFSFQEYFKRMSHDPKLWSQPFAALLGAYDAQIGYGLPSIGGKDSMSGTFNDIDVPPTLISIAVNTAQVQNIITPELKAAGNYLIHFIAPRDEYEIPIYEKVGDTYRQILALIEEKIIISAYAVTSHGLAAAISKMAFGNMSGVKINEDIRPKNLFMNNSGDILAEVNKELLDKLDEYDFEYAIIGVVTDDAAFTGADFSITAAEALEAWSQKLEDVFPTRSAHETDSDFTEPALYKTGSFYVCKEKTARPTVFIPVFPGTNCEYDSLLKFKEAGAKVVTKVFCNNSSADIIDSVAAFKASIDKAQIIMFPGGFSAGDEPDGSAKFFAAAFRNDYIKEAVMRLLNERDGLILGICNGFQALIKLGLVPHGEIVGQKDDSPTLTYNTIGRHISKMVYTKVMSNKSPWLMGADVGAVYVNPASHGEGRFVAPKEWLTRLNENGQVATCYSNPDGLISMDEEWNINGSFAAIEGITSPDGRVFGKMVHVERVNRGSAINIYGQQDMKIFESGVKYFV